jgi:uncharacterized membrane protein YobD (UPF0266 family)
MVLVSLIFMLTFGSRNSEKAFLPGEDTETIHQTSGRKIYYFPLIAIGVITGVAQYMYFGSRLIFIEVIAISIFLVIKRQMRFSQLMIIGLAAAMILAPLGIFYLRHPEPLFSRTNSVTLFDQENIAYNFGPETNWANGGIKILEAQCRQTLSMFLQTGDSSQFYFYGIPAFDPITVLLFWLGLGVVGARLKRLPDFVLFTWFWTGILFGGLLTVGQPNGPRLLMVTPTVYLMGGVFSQLSWSKIRAFASRREFNLSRISAACLVLLAAALTGILVFNVYQYFFVYPDSGYRTLGISIASDIAEEAPANHIFLIGDGYIFSNYGTIRFFANGAKVTDLTKIDDLPSPSDDGKGITVFAVGKHMEELKDLPTRYPKGSWSKFKYLGDYAPGYLEFHIDRMPPH